ncbi:related to helicase [Lecanosticta acicola]|uniref:Related to helicase n=1 Tax=Lecanosticta acicola TaxID=111012 RepID=A0AAI8W0I0_9PEZI|nr:related to helicase [Lecanosticta acicola]
MAFQFDARADSSDEETGGGIDLSSWKTGAAGAAGAGPARKTPQEAPAPIAQMVAPQRDDRSQTSETPNLAAFQNIGKGKRTSKSRTRSPPRPSFQAVNKPLVEPDDEPVYDLDTPEPASGLAGDGDAEEEDDLQTAQRQKLFVQISRDEADRDDFEDLTGGSESVRRVLSAVPVKGGKVFYTVLFDDFHTEKLRRDDLLDFENGEEALSDFKANPPSEDEGSPPPPAKTTRNRRSRMSTTRPTRLGTARKNAGFVNTVDFVDGSDIEASDDGIAVASARGRRSRKQDNSQYYDELEPGDDEEEEEESDDELARPTRTSTRNKANKSEPSKNLRKRRSMRDAEEEEDEDEEKYDDLDLLNSDLPGVKTRGKKRQRRSGADSEDTRHASMRQSARSTRHQADMREKDEGDIFRDASEEPVPVRPKVVTTREIFKPLPRNSDFRLRHYQYCDTCGQGSNFAPLIDCQGCSLTYHKSCLGHRTGREHLVTKVGEEDFVLQCRRCVGIPRKKDHTAPDHGKCQECHHHGASCRPFRPRKTAGQEQRERDDNDGVDPTYSVDPQRINNADNVLFRCVGCFRGFHYEHLPSRSDLMDVDMEVDAEQRFREYSRDWKCRECVDMPAKVSGLIAWKPVEEDAYDPADGYEGLNEEDKVYLVRWEGMSYFRARWMPGAWVWGVTPIVTRKAFAKRDDARHPKMRTEDAIPEDYLRTDIVLDIRFTSIVDIRTEEIDKARIREVKEALIKYKGLSYEDAVWEAPPGPEDGERWTDFVMAYNDWVAGRYTRLPKSATLKTRLEKVRKQDFSGLEKTSQPDTIESGKLMEYQIQGLNWLYYKWFTQKNAILADEMGLGKTIQIIGFMATLVQDHQCWPFLVVVPNSTCPNWRREIKRWAPSLRVVAYYGSRESREKALRYELYPEGCKDVRCHVVVTSYDAAADESCRKFFKSAAWQGLIVDEGQRLKNDKNLLYTALGALKAPFKVLLTGTPLQNNARELFNLLHFLDDNYDAAALEKEYEDLDQEKIGQLHDMIRPFFLRRTKAQVLTFLPPMAQIIIPVSMSLVQKKLYRSILAKNPDLMKAIFSTESSSKQSDRGSLNNILMQLRKCLCHPFVYNKSIEDRNVDIASSHRNLVDASSKLKLLEVLLPKLQERGHRVLIFSQFLEMLDIVEDFMDGMQMRYQRLDGAINALTKQKRIDEFNAPDSALFAFLLSTRAGGVGINLATADTVIILDPDFNPHQDIQALSRAHRIGQNKKVLCFQVVTRASAEERIMQIGRRKLALDHVLIQEMNEDEADQNDLVSVLRHGASELFEDSGDQDIVYDNSSVERLIDRSHMEDTKSGADKSAETQFSFARVWANDQGALEDAAVPEVEETAPDPGVWANILKERERVAAEEAAAKAEEFGRGRRARTNNVDYTGDKVDGADGIDITPIKSKRKRTKEGSESDTDFQADDSDGDDDPEDGEHLENGELKGLDHDRTKPEAGKNKYEVFRRAVVPKPDLSRYQDRFPANGATNQPITITDANNPIALGVNCRACNTYHPVGSCPIKLAGAEHCNLCGIAHYGHARVCPHIQSETQVRAMLEALKYSNEPEHLVNEAKRYLRGLKGNLVQMKKQKEAKEHAMRETYAREAFNRSINPGMNQGGGW